MIKLIGENENGVIHVENEEGVVFGIVSSAQITDEDGIIYEQDALTVLESNGFYLDQDLDQGITFIDFIEENGETSRLIFSRDLVDIISA